MSFQENLLQKIKIDQLAERVAASCGGTAGARHPVDKKAMRQLLALSSYQYRHERDLDLYVKSLEGDLDMILVLDNELPMFRSTVKDVVVRRSPTTLDIWSFRTIRKILVDSDVKVSVNGDSVETVRQDAVAQLDLRYTDEDIEKLAWDGMAWLQGRNAEGVEKILTMFAELLGYRKPPRLWGLDNAVCYGLSIGDTMEKDKVVFEALVLYRLIDNTLAWIEGPFSSADREQLLFLRAVAAGKSSTQVTGDEVFRILHTKVLKRPERVLLP